jgi:NDP-sugar pyrophosphorylase family protein
MIPAGRQVSVERETFPLIIGKTSGLFASRQTGYWIDIGKLDKYRQANFDVLGGVYEPPFGAPQQGGVLLGRKTAFSDGVSVAPPFIAGEKCSIGRSAMLASSIIWDGVKVGAKAVIKNSIVGHKCVIGEGAVVEDAVLRDGTRVNGGTMIKGENK